MNRHSRSTLFLMEQLIVTAVFAICAAACVRILVASYFMATQSRDLSNAIIATENVAECYRAVSGDIDEIANMLEGTIMDDGSGILFFFDSDWQKCDEQSSSFVMTLSYERHDAGPTKLSIGEVSIEKSNGDVIISIPVAASALHGFYPYGSLGEAYE